VDKAESLKALTGNVLAEPGDNLGDPTAFLDTALEQTYTGHRLPDSARKEIINELNSLVNSVYGRAREINQKVAWRCLKCNTVNGLQLGSYERVRKTCKKCAQPRKNELTVAQELAVEVLIETEQIDYKTAVERIKELA